MSLIVLAASAAVLCWLYLRVKPRMRQVGPFLPDSFVFGVGLYTVGALLVLAANGSPAAYSVAAMSLVALNSALSGAVLFAFACSRFYINTDFRRQFGNLDSGRAEVLLIKAVLLLSGLISLAFVYAVFANSVIAGLLSIASLSGDAALLEARKAITSGTEGYLAPGYVKQFRDILIPVGLMSLMATSPGYRRNGLTWFAGTAAIIAMLVSGQRLVFVVFFLALLLASYYANRFPERVVTSVANRTGSLWLVALLLASYALLTFLLGRATGDVSPGVLATDVVVNFADRVFLAAPRENVLTWPVWQSLGPTMGESWLADLGGVLPGASESLANVLHSATGGSALGNSPLGLPPDVWLAWGWAGLVVVPALYGFAAGLLDLVLVSRRSAIFFGLKSYLFVVLPICYSPYLFVLYGGAAAILLILAVGLLRSGAWWRANSLPA